MFKVAVYAAIQPLQEAKLGELSSKFDTEREMRCKTTIPRDRERAGRLEQQEGVSGHEVIV